MQATVPSSADLGFIVCAFSLVLIPLATAGLALMNTGLGRSRSASHAMLSSLVAVSVAALIFFVFGWTLAGGSGSAHTITAGGKQWNWLGAGRLLMRGIRFDSKQSLTACFEMLAIGLLALIPLGAGADRWRLRAICFSSALLAGLTFPLFAHWTWGGGWLAQLGTHFGLGAGFADYGGAGTIHVVGGLTALSVTWIMGPRYGKYDPHGLSAAIPGHNSVFVLFGCLLVFVGFVALDTAGALLFGGSPVTSLLLIAINNMLAAGSALIAALVLTAIRYGKPDASLCANGFVAGLVAASCACDTIAPVAALAIGMVAGLICPLFAEWLDRMAIDDPSGSISVHALAGTWGILASGIFIRRPGQFWAQLVGVATLIGFMLPLTYSLNFVLNRFCPQRAPREAERQGMDMHELGAGAYPEFSAMMGDVFHQ